MANEAERIAALDELDDRPYLAVATPLAVALPYSGMQPPTDLPEASTPAATTCAAMSELELRQGASP